MSKQISINICKILNWCLTNTNLKLQVSFYTLRTHNYLAHKSTIGYFNSQALILNTSFHINFHPSQHIILCKISDLRDKNDIKHIGQIEIDLNLLSQRKVLFLPFQDHDKVLQVRVYQTKKDKSIQKNHLNDEEVQEKRQQFLQERFNFLDKLNEHQNQLKKRFSEKVYNLLKQLKNQNHESKADKQVPKSQIDREIKSNKNELQFRNRLDSPKKKSQFHLLEAKNNKISPIKSKYDHELMIHSVHAKTEHKVQTPEHLRIKTDSPTGQVNSKGGMWHMKEESKHQKNEIRNQGNTGNTAFGGIINNYLDKYTGYAHDL